MSPFITEDFLLLTEAARRLYHDYARDMPIVDYHCHLPPDQVATDHRFENVAQIWLAGDHYKWRAMRAAGVEERYCTGDAADWDKFEKWAETVPKTLRNPLYHWTHLELRRPLGIDDVLLSPATARDVWDRCNEKLSLAEFSCRGIMKQMNVALVCTTDDPVDSLEHHAAIAADPSFDIQVLPTFRPDRAMAVESPEEFNAWVDRLAEASGIDVTDFESFVEALDKRHEHFHQQGCRLSDHGLQSFLADEYAATDVATAFRRIQRGNRLTPEEANQFKSAMLHELAVMNHQRNWTQQYHYGALRNNNTRMFEAIGRDTGFDSMGDWLVAEPLSRFLDRLDRQDKLTRTIVYNLNPRDNDLIATMLGNFQDGRTPGKMQYGSGWWFLDQKSGMEAQLEALSNHGLLSQFVGMLTDSRSFLSYTRHEYFRRILCNLLGSEMDRGSLPGDFQLIGGMVRDICYNNAARYFGFELDTA